MIRSLLYVPASSERYVANAHQRGADAVILDLEDGVAEEAKDGARAALTNAVTTVGQDGALVFVRVNSSHDRLFLDVEAACRAGAYGILVPKVDTPDVLQAIGNFLAPIEAGLKRQATRFVPIIESPGAVLDARAIALGSSRVLGLITGGEDLAAAMGATPESLRIPKVLVHLAAKAAGLLSFGLLHPIANYRDVDGIVAATAEARALGFDGATCVHPDVVPLLNAGFSPSRADIEKAAGIVAAFETAKAAGKGAVSLDGQMIDLPVVLRARRVLLQAQRT